MIKRFVTFLTGAGVCLILIIYYFVTHTKAKEDALIKPANSLNADLPNAGDSTGLPARSKLELASEGHGLAMPDQLPMERGLNSTVPATIQPNQPGRSAADSYIYGTGVPSELYQNPEADPASKKSSRKAPELPPTDLGDDDEEPTPGKNPARI